MGRPAGRGAAYGPPDIDIVQPDKASPVAVRRPVVPSQFRVLMTIPSLVIPESFRESAGL